MENTYLKINNSKSVILHPYKDFRCSHKCYLNWVKYGQRVPIFHRCKCNC